MYFSSIIKNKVLKTIAEPYFQIKRYNKRAKDNNKQISAIIIKQILEKIIFKQKISLFMRNKCDLSSKNLHRTNVSLR